LNLIGEKSETSTSTLSIAPVQVVSEEVRLRTEDRLKSLQLESIQNEQGEGVSVVDNKDRMEQDSSSEKNINDSLLFSGLSFFLSREVPRESLEFVILAFGGKVTCEETVEAEGDETITHQIMDRPSQRHQYLYRQYIQPQWIYDSVNVGKLLPTAQYLPGVKLPPHLSPFVNDELEGYIPERRKELSALLGLQSQGEEKEGENVVKLTEEEKQVEMEKNYKRELYSELGVKEKGGKRKEREEEKEKEKEGESKKVKKGPAQAFNDEQSRSLLLSNRKRRLYNKIQASKNNAVERNEKLVSKKKNLDLKKVVKSK